MKKIIELIIDAQIASDAGKGICTLKNALCNTAARRWAARKQYFAKDQFIKEAVFRINKCHPRGCRYTVVPGGITPYLVYFDFNIEGARYQVSFHTYSCAFKNMCGKGNPVKWDEDSSRHTCLALARRVGIF